MTSEFVTDDQGLLLEPNLHDHHLVMVRKFPDGSLEITFKSDKDEVAVLQFDGASSARYWSAGIALPLIVSVIMIYPRVLNVDQISQTFRNDESSRLYDSHRTHFPRGGWALVIEANDGDTSAVFGAGVFAPQFRIE